jgi:DNA-binding FadR family transcriptional regulator
MNRDASGTLRFDAASTSPYHIQRVPLKMAEELAYAIESEIMRLGWPSGQILGSETELIERYGVSRAVFREAVRLVEHHGAARMRRGPNGGLVVTTPDFRSVQRPATLYLDYADVSTTDLITARGALEMSCVALASERLDEEGVILLQGAIQREEDIGFDDSRDGIGHDLHVVIAQLSGNPVHLLFVQTLASLTFERTRELPYDRHELEESHRAHKAIVDALISGDGPIAQQRMRRHLTAALKSYRRRGADSSLTRH